MKRFKTVTIQRGGSVLCCEHDTLYVMQYVPERAWYVCLACGQTRTVEALCAAGQLPKERKQAELTQTPIVLRPAPRTSDDSTGPTP